MKVKRRFLGITLSMVFCVLAVYVVASGTIESSSGNIKLDPGSGVVYIDGDLGVGTGSPSQKVDIAGALKVNSNMAGGELCTTCVILDNYDGYTRFYSMKDNSNMGGFRFIRREADGGMTDEAMRITTDGLVGINTTNPALNSSLDVAGYIHADGLWTDSPFYDGDNALNQITAISCLEDSEEVDGWCDVDHDSLPEGVKVVLTEARLQDPKTHEIIDPDNIPPEEWENYDTIYVKVDARDVDKMIQVLVKGVQELNEQNNLLKIELCSKDDTYSFCSG